MAKFISESDLILNPDGSIYHLGLHPGEVAETILTVGDPDRVARVSQHFDSIELTRHRREFVTHTGYVGTQRVTVISSGMGTDNVEILMTELDALFNLDFQTRTVRSTLTSLRMIRLGTSGSLREELPLDSLAYSQLAFGLDTLMQFYELPQSDEETALAHALQQTLQLCFLPYCVHGSDALTSLLPEGVLPSITATCPGFYAPQGRIGRLSLKRTQFIDTLRKPLLSNYSIGNLEMETAGYYALARLFGHDFLSLNAIVAHRPSGLFSPHPERTMTRLIELTLAML